MTSNEAPKVKIFQAEGAEIDALEGKINAWIRDTITPGMEIKDKQSAVSQVASTHGGSRREMIVTIWYGKR